MRSKRRLGGFSCRAERLPTHTHAHPNSAPPNRPGRAEVFEEVYTGVAIFFKELSLGFTSNFKSLFSSRGVEMQLVA